MKTIYQAIADIMAEGYAVGKDSKNTQQGFMYRGIDAVMNTFQPLLAKHGVFVVPKVLECTREERQTKNGGNLIYTVLKMRYTFYSEDGTYVEAEVQGEGMDSADKSSNKAMAVAMKYALFQVFCIPTEEMKEADPDAYSPEPSTPKKEPEPMKFVCANCNKVLTPYINETTGKEVPIRQHADGSIKKFGKVLCIHCIQTQQADNAN